LTVRNQLKLNLISVLVASGAAAMACLPAHAQEQATGQGPYIGGNLGAARLKGDDAPGLPTDRSSTGYKLYGGYGFTSNVAVEAGYADTGKFDSSAGSLRGRGLFADAVGRLPVAQDFSLLGRVGLVHGRLRDGRNGASLTETATNFKGGLGAQYDLSKNSAIRGEWERYRFDTPNSGTAKADLFTVGYKHQF
jgi:OOP family OmpA-OmpF porin